MSPISFVILAFGTLGHAILWPALVNRLHAYAVPRRWVKWLTVLCGLMLVIIPPIGAAIFSGVFPTRSAAPASFLRNALWCYLAFCAALSVVAIVQRLWWYRHPERCGSLANHTSIVCDVDKDERLTAPGIPTWLSWLPGNEVLKLCVQEKQVAIPRLAESYEPLRIVHISDLHMSGRLTRAYFERVVEHVNACQVDLVAITGDIVERDHCLDWIPATLGRLQAAAGVYYVLGNHDRMVNVTRLNAGLADAGLVHLSGGYHQRTIRGTPVILAGNELPWFKPAADLVDCPGHDSAGVPLRILLAHSPDQFAWAQANDIDLILAGHLHGGQVRLPVLGAILAPSRHGVRYAAGVFTAGKTVMHVSRGTGSLTPLRYNCPPEIAVLTLCALRTES